MGGNHLWDYGTKGYDVTENVIASPDYQLV